MNIDLHEKETFGKNWQLFEASSNGFSDNLSADFKSECCEAQCLEPSIEHISFEEIEQHWPERWADEWKAIFPTNDFYDATIHNQ